MEKNRKVPAQQLVADTMLDVDAPEQQEKQGYISKKNTIGFYQSRFFVTNGRRLSYWTDETAYLDERALLASEKDPSRVVSMATVYDIVAMRVVEMGPERTLHIRFSNDKFKLDLQFRSETERSEWTSLILAKKNLHSIQELRRAVAEQHVVILTPTFQNLLRLEEEDQDTWMIERIEDIFEVAEGSEMEGQGPCIASLRRARSAIDELLLLCQDCELELGSRNPRVGVHCKAYVQRFAMAINGRILLELQAVLMAGWNEDEGSGSSETGSEGLCRRLAMLGTESLCEAISLMGRVERLKRYAFMPSGYVQSLYLNLFSMGEVISAYLNLAIGRVEAWFQNTVALAPQQRGLRFEEFFDVVVADILRGAELDSKDTVLQIEIQQRLVIAALLTYSDQLALVQSNTWGQQSVLQFVGSLQKTLHTVDSGWVYWEQPESRYKNRLAVETPRQKKGKMCSLQIPEHAAEAVRMACYQTAADAAHAMANAFESGLATFAAPIFKIKLADGWEGDQACALLLSHIGSWGMHSKGALPAFLARQIQRRCAAMAVNVYIGELNRAYKAHRSELSFGKKAIMQLDRDLSSIERFVASLSDAEQGALPESEIVRHLRVALIAPTEPAEAFGAAFWPAVVTFGLSFGLILYDLYRLMLKLRADVRPLARKLALGYCSGLLATLQGAVTVDTTLFSAWGGTGAHDRTHILHLLCPRIGIEHCTGSKWTVEKAPEDPVSQLHFQQHVLEALEAARCRQEHLAAVERKAVLAARATVRRPDTNSVADSGKVHVDRAREVNTERAAREENTSMRSVEDSNDRRTGRVTRKASGAGVSLESAVPMASATEGDSSGSGKVSQRPLSFTGNAPLYPPPPLPVAVLVTDSSGLPVASATPLVKQGHKKVHRHASDTETGCPPPHQPPPPPPRSHMATKPAVPSATVVMQQTHCVDNTDDLSASGTNYSALKRLSANLKKALPPEHQEEWDDPPPPYSSELDHSTAFGGTANTSAYSTSSQYIVQTEVSDGVKSQQAIFMSYVHSEHLQDQPAKPSKPAKPLKPSRAGISSSMLNATYPASLANGTNGANNNSGTTKVLSMRTESFRQLLITAQRNLAKSRMEEQEQLEGLH